MLSEDPIALLFSLTKLSEGVGGAAWLEDVGVELSA